MDLEGKNIILVVADTLSAFHLPIYGYDRDTAPFLTELAENNKYVKYGYSTAPWTVPSHASLFSGKLPFEHGATAEDLRFEGHSFVSDLNDEGYSTLGFSSNPLVAENLGFSKGFDNFISGEEIQLRDKGAEVFGDFFTNFSEGSKFKRYLKFFFSCLKRRDFKSLLFGLKYIFEKKLGRNIFRNFYFDMGARSINNLVEEKLEEVNENFFLFVNYNEAHTPFFPPKKHALRWIDDPEDAMDVFQEGFIQDGFTSERWSSLPENVRNTYVDLYDAEISYLDEKIKELYELIDDSFEDYVFLIVSDHGENIGDYGMNKHQCGIWEKLIRIPIIIAGPDVEREVVDGKVSIKDVHKLFTEKKNLSELISEEVFSEYYGLKNLYQYKNNDIGKFNDDEMKYLRNCSKCMVRGDEGLITNTNLSDFTFIQREDSFKEKSELINSENEMRRRVNRFFGKFKDLENIDF